MIEHHDPNRARSMGTAALIELTFMAWDHAAVHTVRIGGNVPGLGNMLEIAIDQVIDQLPISLTEGDSPEMTLTRQTDGARMSVDRNTNPEQEFEEMLKEMLVGARIVALVDADRGNTQ